MCTMSSRGVDMFSTGVSILLYVLGLFDSTSIRNTDNRNGYGVSFRLNISEWK